MKKQKFQNKLSLGKTNVSNLGEIKGGYITFKCRTNFCGTNNCGTDNCGTNACGTNNCATNNHPLSDPLHCRTCHGGC
ncbi:MAG: hypothetical protein AB8B65_01200 [Kordia sp.]|uniref:hypothetical protein n=1 Tax=Kordia sp. TaxID=1965332 RepID=UPI00385E1561